MGTAGDHAEPGAGPPTDDGLAPPAGERTGSDVEQELSVPGVALPGDDVPPDAGCALPDLIRPPATRRALGTRIVLGSLGVLCLVLGVVGWLIPVVTGVPFYLLGLLLLGAAVPALGRRINAWERRLPRRWRLLLRPKLRRAEKQRARGGGTGSAE